SRKDFFHFTQSTIKSHSSIQALEWIPYVIDEERELFRQKAINDGLQDYAIRRRDSSGQLIPVEQQPEYYPVYYVEPLNQNKVALGVDLGSNPVRLKGLELARITRNIQATASISLIQEKEEQKGFLIFDPIYKQLNNSLDPADDEFKGFALGVFRIGDLFDTAISPFKSLLDPLIVTVTDVTDLNNTTLLHSHSHLEPLQPLIGSQWHYSQNIHFANRSWKISSTASTDFYQQYSNNTHWFVLGFGILITLIISFYLRSLIHREAEIKALVKQRSHELDLSEKMNQAIFKSAVDAIITIDIKGIVNLYSPAAEKLFGYSPEEVIGQNVKMLMPEPYRSEHDGYLRHHQETGVKRIIGIGREVQGRRKDGSTFPMNLSVGKSQVNNTVIYIGTVTDLTKIKQKELESREFSDRLDLATRAGSIGVWDYNVIDGSLEWDQQMYQLYGKTFDENHPVDYAVWKQTVHPEDSQRTEAELNEAINGGKQFDSEFRIHWSDGQVRFIKGSGLVLFDESQKAQRMIGINMDITLQKNTEQALLQAKQAAESANRQKSAFLNTMSHELRTPLTVILGYIPLLKSNDNPLPADTIVQIAEDMDLSGQHLLEMINDLLDISKIEAGEMILDVEQIQAQLIIQETIRKFENLAQQKNIELQSDAVDFNFSVDPRRLRQILINLVGNALKFAHQGSIKISAQDEAEFVTFNITDTGIGIAESDLPFVFDTFRQVDNSTTRKTGGSGLGLAITKKLVELHGGTIRVESILGRGTSFIFSLKK
ncbi:MAG: CHASE domain-containing protein, partial [Gammaproteobacteria bacterium]|nr:CHASE domain-containing protein [Gammaproteobacteria bacterium]